MSFFDGVLNRLGLERKAEGKDTYPPFMLSTADHYRWTMPDYGTTESQERLYAKLTWVYDSVTFVSQAAAGVPLKVKRRQGEKLQDIENHPFERLLERPNPLMSRFEFLEAWFAYKKLTGNAYVWLNMPGPTSPPSELWIIPSDRIKPIPDGRMGLRGYRYDTGNGGPPLLLEPWEVLHDKTFNPLNPYSGLSPIESMAVSAVGELAMEKWNTAYFDKDNAKVPGFLAFADPINDYEWEQMKDEFSKQYSQKRKMMMLRNVGKGGVEWVATTLTQKDMEFLAGRQFNKELIYNKFAPGLASMLAINATEANSRTGKATMMEYAVWPMHTGAAEKITNGLLHLYEDNLRAEFDDVRLADTAMELNEIQTASSYFTIDEVRTRFYDANPIGDERGSKLVKEIGSVSNSGGLFGRNEDDTPSRMRLSDGGEIETAGQPKAVVIDATAEPVEVRFTAAQKARDELLTWQRWYLKRLDKDDVREFETEHISSALKGAIEGQLEAEETAEGVRSIFTDALNALEWQDYP